eukprot:1778924-Prymnesium_polylepis.1
MPHGLWWGAGCRGGARWVGSVRGRGRVPAANCRSMLLAWAAATTELDRRGESADTRSARSCARERWAAAPPGGLGMSSRVRDTYA